MDATRPPSRSVAAPDKPTRFVVTLEPTDPSHSIHALRHFLKSALRRFGLRCVNLEETHE
jgi:hypothetical protein